MTDAREKNVWMRDGKPWSPPEGWQEVHDALREYGAKPDHMYTDVERIMATHAFDLADAVIAALSLLADRARMEKALRAIVATCDEQVRRLERRGMSHEELDLAISDARHALGLGASQ